MAYEYPSNRDVEWAIETFRPLLKELQVQDVQDEPRIVKVADFRILVIKGMGRCVLAIQKQRMSDEQKGYCVFIYRKEVNVYILSIVIDEKLFENDSLDLKIQRKALGVHEFVHCVAIMMSVSFLGAGANPLIARLREILNDKLAVTTTNDFAQLLKALGAIKHSSKDIQNISLFSDKHFRTGFEDFKDDYADLFLNFLFSYKLLKEIITQERMLTFKTLIDSQETEQLTKFLNDIMSEIVDTKALDKKFVFTRFLYFLPRLSSELLETK